MTSEGAGGLLSMLSRTVQFRHQKQDGGDIGHAHFCTRTEANSEDKIREPRKGRFDILRTKE